VKKSFNSAGMTVGTFVALLVITGSVTGCQASAPAGNASPAATATAMPTLTVLPTRTPTAAARVKAQPKQPHVTQAPPAMSPAAPPPPAPHTAAPPAPPAAQAPPAPPAPKKASCYPLSNEGTCYEPGEFCRKADHGTSGVAGDGEAITCEDNNGWRWEPS
jgi:hypothetical protein